MEVVIPFKPRPLQKEILAQQKRFSVIVAHRRAGKTVLCVNWLVRAALMCKRPRPRVAYIAPLYRQAKQSAWDFAKHYTSTIPGRVAHEAELRIDLPNGARIQLFGADNPDALRGIYLDGVVLDEYAQMSPRLWGEVIRPLLADREGYAIFIGTPRGRNAFCELYEAARDGESGPDWSAALYRASETGILPDAELRAAEHDMGEDEYAQEFECSFTAAIKGAYYGKDMARADDEDRICAVPHESASLVHTAWDLGIGDSTAIWFFQQVGREIHMIDYLEASGVGLDWYVKELHAKPYIYGEHILPHDAEAKELGTGKSRTDVLRGLGVVARVLPRAAIDDGINAVRMILSRCWFDRVKCATGIEALRQYQRKWDESNGVFRPTPLHDRHSHGADAMRYLAMGLVEEDRAPRRSRELLGTGGWMAS